MPRAPRYACGRCGKKAVAEQMIYSRFTGNRYCVDLGACARRSTSKKRRKVGASDGR